VIKKSFRGEIFFYYIIVFILFTSAILAFQYTREKNYRIAQLENTLDNISEITHRFILQQRLIEKNELDQITALSGILPQPNVRITLISNTGKVLYDSFVKDYNLMENHLDRPEIQKALINETGSNIRHSETTDENYYYYARRYREYLVRTALVYNVQIKNFLKAERVFIFFMISVFGIIGFILFFVTDRLSVAITKLKDFSIKAGKNELVEHDASFPDNELGVIG
jgi:two-component system OmpR family sensor kinase/two-component system phosphate regulon sensor histidine kinase PhoR